MYTLFVVFIVLVSVLMIFVVLIQESKGGGLASNFSSSNAIMGVRKTTDFIEKATWGLAAIMVIVSVICAYTAPQSSTSQSVLEQAATETQTTNFIIYFSSFCSIFLHSLQYCSYSFLYSISSLPFLLFFF